MKILKTFLFYQFIIIVCGWPLANDGIIEPESHHQRYRINEYDQDKPFFQWWYYCVKDLKNNKYYAITYGMTKTVDNKHTNQASAVMFATRQVEGSQIKGFQKYEKYKLENLNVLNDFDYQLKDDQNQTKFKITVLNHDTYHLEGNMSNPDATWQHEGCDKNLTIQWNLTIHRIFGWYGQADIEKISKIFAKGEIGWNTYAHNSEIEGTIKIGDEIILIERNKNFRAYGDMNWGNTFPLPGKNEKSIDYPWAWYDFVDANEDPTKDVSVIMGTGKGDIGFPFNNIFGAFGEVRIGKDIHVGFRIGQTWVGSKIQFDALKSTNDGKLINFQETRSNWINFTDVYGSAEIPLRQQVELETTNYRIMLDFQTTAQNYNRLLFVSQDYIFSDFEGLACQVNLTVLNTQTNQILYQNTLQNGGLEYGYKVPLIIPDFQQMNNINTFLP